MCWASPMTIQLDQNVQMKDAFQWNSYCSLNWLESENPSITGKKTEGGKTCWGVQMYASLNAGCSPDVEALKATQHIEILEANESLLRVFRAIAGVDNLKAGGKWEELDALGKYNIRHGQEFTKWELRKKDLRVSFFDAPSAMPNGYLGEIEFTTAFTIVKKNCTCDPSAVSAKWRLVYGHNGSITASVV
jgi:hypothetical protein